MGEKSPISGSGHHGEEDLVSVGVGEEDLVSVGVVHHRVGRAS